MVRERLLCDPYPASAGMRPFLKATIWIGRVFARVAGNDEVWMLQIGPDDQPLLTRLTTDQMNSEYNDVMQMLFP